MRKALRKRPPTAHEMVYDNYNFFVIGYGPTERPSDAILRLPVVPTGSAFVSSMVPVFPDPQRILLGSGNQTRFIRVDSAEVLDRPAVNALISAAIAKARLPLQSSGRGSLIIRSVLSKQRPRKRAKR